MDDGLKTSGIVALAASGITSAFALAACCVIPMLLVSAGLGVGWLMPLVTASQPYADLLTGFSAIALAGSSAIVIRAGRLCLPGSLCAKPVFRWSIISAAIMGALLLVASKIYA